MQLETSRKGSQMLLDCNSSENLSPLQLEELPFTSFTCASTKNMLHAIQGLQLMCTNLGLTDMALYFDVLRTALASNGRLLRSLRGIHPASQFRSDSKLVQLLC